METIHRPTHSSNHLNRLFAFAGISIPCRTLVHEGLARMDLGMFLLLYFTLPALVPCMLERFPCTYNTNSLLVNKTIGMHYPTVYGFMSGRRKNIGFFFRDATAQAFFMSSHTKEYIIIA